MKRTFWSVVAIVFVICAGCGAPPEGDGSSETDAIHSEGSVTGEDDPAVAEEDFDSGAAESLAVGDETADGQETHSN